MARPSTSRRAEHGMTTAEYSTGTIGTVMIAAVLYKLGLLDADNPWMEAFRRLLHEAFSWHRLFGMFGRSGGLW